VPSVRRYNRAHLLYFNGEYFRRNHGFTNVAAVLGAYALCYVVTFIVKQ
jgi:hypothetical protein